jgi:hypothetical protein
MPNIVQFVIRRLATRAFWLLVITTFLGILMYDLRSNFKDQVFQDALANLKANHWPGWKTP